METCIICREVPATFGESYCEVCVRQLDTRPEKKILAHGFPPQGNTPLSGQEESTPEAKEETRKHSVTIRESEVDGDDMLTITSDTRRLKRAV